MIASACLAMALWNCGGSAKPDAKGFYGQAFDPSAAVSLEQALVDYKGKGAKDAVIKGEIAAVCQAEGCWYRFKGTDGETFVDFDHKFTIGKDTKGKTAIAKGYFYSDTTSVEQLQHYAEDDGKSKEEIAKITESEIKLNFRATGVKIE